MSSTRFGTVIGLVIGAVWALTGFTGAVLTAVLGAVGYVVALMLQGRVDVTEYLGHRHDR